MTLPFQKMENLADGKPVTNAIQTWILWQTLSMYYVEKKIVKVT